MDWQIVVLASVVGYLCGSVSFARIVSRLVDPNVDIEGIDLDDRRVDAISGTAVSMKLGPRYGGLTAILDILKVAVPTLIFRILYRPEPYFLFTAALGLVGHNWPLYYRFKGGRGLSAIMGGFLVVDWIGTLVTSIVGMALGLLVVKNVLVSYLAGLWLMIPWVWFRTRQVSYVLYIVFANVVFVAALIPEVRRGIEEQRQGAASDLSHQMDATPMGKMIKKMGARVGLFEAED